MANIAYVAAGTHIFGGSTSTSITVPVPAGLASGDVMLLIGSSLQNSLATPAGWTLLATQDPAPSTYRFYVWYKVAGGAEGSVVVSTAAGTSYIDGQIVAYRNVLTSSPIDAAAVWGTNTSLAAVPTPAITTVTANSEVVFVGFGDTAPTWDTPPSGATKRLESTPLNVQKFIVADELKTPAGLVAADTYTRSASGGAAMVTAFALEPIPSTDILLPHSVSGSLRT